MKTEELISVAGVDDHLERLSWWVAEALDTGDSAGPWRITQALEGLLEDGQQEPTPPVPVIGRRFARAHRSLLTAGREVSARVLAVRPPVPEESSGTDRSTVPCPPHGGSATRGRPDDVRVTARTTMGVRTA